MSESSIADLMPGPKEISFLVLRGVGMFLSVTGMVGMALMLGPLNSIIGINDLTYINDSKVLSVSICFGLTVVGGAFDFIAGTAIKTIEKEKESA